MPLLLAFAVRHSVNRWGGAKQYGDAGHCAKPNQEEETEGPRLTPPAAWDVCFD